MAEPEGANPGVLYNAGRATLALGRLDEAGAYFRRAIDSSDRLTPAARELGLLRIQQGHFFRAYLLLRPWVLTHPKDTQARLGATMCAVELERAAEAQRFLSDLDQKDPLVKLLWARTLLLGDDPWGAVAILKPLLEDSPPSLEQDIRRVMARAQLGIGRPEEALELLASQDRADPYIARLLSQAYEDSGDLEGAIVALRPFADLILAADGDESSGFTPDIAASMVFDHGRLLAATGAYEEAIPYLQLAVQLVPTSQHRWEELSRSLTALERDQAAAAAMGRAEELAAAEIQLQAGFFFGDDPDDSTGQQLQKALELAQKTSLSEALALVQRESMLASKEDPRPTFVEIRLLMQLGSFDTAQETAKVLVERFPFNADAYYQLAVVEMAREDLATAEGNLEKTLELSPEHTAALNDLAVLKIQMGKSEEAQQLLEKLLVLRPDDTVAAQNLDKLRQGGE
jgi:tetratricopeptide (TPR) repeat protein